jgi:hypothetical protein
MPSCGVVTYRERAPLLNNAITRVEDHLAQAYTGHINGRCHSNKLVQNVFSANLEECMLACDEHRFCQFFEQIGPSCFLYDECNMAPAEFGDLLYNLGGDYPSNFVAYEKQEITELLPFANYAARSLIPTNDETPTVTVEELLIQEAPSNDSDVAMVVCLFAIGMVAGIIGMLRLTRKDKNYKRVSSEFYFK